MNNLLKIMLILCTFLFWCPSCFSEGFSSEVMHINAAGFPKISTTIKVFNKTPEIVKSENFRITEDKLPVATFSLDLLKQKQFILIILDRSSSIKPAVNQVKQAASNFARSLNGKSNLALMSFGSDIDFSQNFTTDTGSILEAIRKVRPWGGTALYDAIYTGCEELSSKAGRNDLKTIVCLTDGVDSTPNGKKPMSIKKPEEVYTLANKNKIRIVTVGLGNEIDSTILTKFATKTGGWYLQASSAGQLNSLYAALSKRIQLEKYYRLTYLTPDPKFNGTIRYLEISSQFKGEKDQGKGSYRAPNNPPKQLSVVKNSLNGADSKNANKGATFSITSLFLDLKISDPDRAFLTGPIIPPPPSPIFGLNAAALVSLDANEQTNLINQKALDLENAHANELQKQYRYLDSFTNGLDRISKLNEEKSKIPSPQQFELDRIEYRRRVIDFRKQQISLIKNKCYEIYTIKLDCSLKENELLRKEFVDGIELSASDHLEIDKLERDKIWEIEKKYDSEIEAVSRKEAAMYKEFAPKREANVESNLVEIKNLFNADSEGNIESTNSFGEEIENDYSPNSQIDELDNKIDDEIKNSLHNIKTLD